MLEFLRIQYLLGKVSKEQLLNLMALEKITLDQYLEITKE